MKVVGWTEWDDNTWSRTTEHTWDEARAAVIEALRAGQYKFTGDYHQNGDFGVPVLDNGEVFQVSQRQWGSIMADAYPEEHAPADEYSYTRWAWIAPGEMKIPEE